MLRPAATSILNQPSTTPTLSVVLTTLCARNVIGPVKSGSPAAAPVYLPFVTTIALPSLVVHVLVETFDVAAVNVPATALAVFAPSIPCATATLVASSATRPAAESISLRMDPPVVIPRGTMQVGHSAALRRR